MKDNKKINNMSTEELLKIKESLEKKTEHIKKTKSKNNPKTIKWSSDQTYSVYYKHIIQELKNRNTF